MVPRRNDDGVCFSSGRTLAAESSKRNDCPSDRPFASFTFACSGHACTFDGSGSSDADGTIASYAWSFGDASSGAGPAATHTYIASSSFNVTLTVTDNNGATGTQSQTVSIANTPPAASFTFACSSLACTFDGSASSDGDGTIASYVWNFGDGAGGSGSTAAHTYGSPGTFTVTVTVTDNAAATNSAARSVTVTRLPMHVGDLDGSSQRISNAWKATVTVTVHDAGHNRVANASVAGSWSSGESSGCVTNSLGQCFVTSSTIKIASVTFNVQSVTNNAFMYQPSSNHDPDGDSNGTAITLRKP